MSARAVDIEEEPIQTRDQGIRFLHTRKVPVLDSSGKPLYLLGISEDITERRQMENERRLLTDVSVTLSASLDYEQTFGDSDSVGLFEASLDWCAVDVAGGAGAPQATEGCQRGRFKSSALHHQFPRSGCRPTETCLFLPGLCSRVDAPSSSSRSPRSISNRLRRGRNTYKPFRLPGSPR